MHRGGGSSGRTHPAEPAPTPRGVRHRPATLARCRPACERCAMNSSTNRFRGVLRVVGAWAVVATIFVSQNIMRDVVRGRPIGWTSDLTGEVLYWVPWVLLTPALVAVARRWPLG